MNDTATAQQKTELLAIIDAHPEIDWYALLEPMFANTPADKNFTKHTWEPVIAAILQKEGVSRNVPPPEAFSSRRFIWNSWARYAAAALIIFGIGAYLWMNGSPESPVVQTSGQAPVPNDMLPGSDRAILTLSNGEKIKLDNSATQLITDGQLEINNANGELIYGKTAVLAYNTMTTPRGGQYKLELPDGTKVWLNAASSITYPTVFEGGERSVNITGEVYFEVAKNPKIPFKVKVNKATEIEVLGTHFNVNAYADELAVNTTLLEGSVRIKANKGLQTLSPGQQAQVNAAGIVKLVKDVDIAQVIAWKNGLFLFENADVHTLMRQMARWYDVEVIFEGQFPPQADFVGGMQRSLNLSQALKGLGSMGLKFELKGRQLIVRYSNK